jgi:hypothetical protein
MREWILFSLTSKDFAKNSAGGYIIHRGPRPPHADDWPRGFSSRKGGWSFEEIVETKVDSKHHGRPYYKAQDAQVARITRFTEPPERALINARYY